MRRTITFCYLGLLAAMGAGCRPTAGGTAAAVPIPKVTVAPLEQRELTDYDQYNGWLQANETVEVRSRVRGHIARVHFTDGQIVKEGKLLIELDPRPFQAEVDRARDQVRVFEAQHLAAYKDELRQRELVKSGAVSVSDFEKAEADTKSLQAQVAAAQGEITRRELDLEYSRITAPIGGRIGRAFLTVGNLVNAGGSDPLLTTIVKDNPIYIYFYVDERSMQRYLRNNPRARRDNPDLKSVRDLQVPIEFGLETDDGFPHRGIIDFVENQLDAGTGTIQIRAVADNQHGLFVPGSRVRVRVPMSKTYQAALVPDTAILADQDKRYVLALDDKNIVHRRDVVPGKLLDDGMRVILPGAHEKEALAADTRVIVLGLQRARVNYPVDPVGP